MTAHRNLRQKTLVMTQEIASINGTQTVKNKCWFRTSLPIITLRSIEQAIYKNVSTPKPNVYTNEYIFSVTPQKANPHYGPIWFKGFWGKCYSAVIPPRFPMVWLEERLTYKISWYGLAINMVYMTYLNVD
jgi:hypothetical protein